MMKVRIDQRILNELMSEARAHDPAPPVDFLQTDQAKHFALEAIASALLTYSYFYIPDAADPLKQYVGAISLFTISVSLKDAKYFFPDTTPVTTVVLWAATLYTDNGGVTDWLDIACRMGGQLAGFLLAFAVAFLNADALKQGAYVCAFVTTNATHAFNEGLGTMIEAIAIAFAVIPLLSPYMGNTGFQSKAEEISPPNQMRLCRVAFVLSLVHYTLERLLQATMNPLATLLQYYVLDEGGNPWIVVAAQLVGLALACIYVQWCMPKAETIRQMGKN